MSVAVVDCEGVTLGESDSETVALPLPRSELDGSGLALDESDGETLPDMEVLPLVVPLYDGEPLAEMVADALPHDVEHAETLNEADSVALTHGDPELVPECVSDGVDDTETVTHAEMDGDGDALPLPRSERDGSGLALVESDGDTLTEKDALPHAVPLTDGEPLSERDARALKLALAQ